MIDDSSIKSDHNADFLKRAINLYDSPWVSGSANKKPPEGGYTAGIQRRFRI
jgi:hypothetical protein